MSDATASASAAKPPEAQVGAPVEAPASLEAASGPTVSAPSPAPRQDDDRSFDGFYRLFIAHLVAFLVWQGAGLADAADLAQEAMIDAYRSWQEIEHPRAWVKRVASRKHARRIAQVERPAEPEAISLLLRDEIDVSEWEDRHEVLRLLNKRPPRQRQVLAWTCDGYTPAEIAAELAISSEAVRSSLARARRSLAIDLQLKDSGSGDGDL